MTKIRSATGPIIWAACNWGHPRQTCASLALVPTQDHVNAYGTAPATGEHASILAVLRRRVLVIVAVTILAGAAAAAFAYATRNTYQSTAKLWFSQTISPELNDSFA